MQAHASDLRVEVENDSSGLTSSDAIALVLPAGCNAFVHQAVNDWRQCPVTTKVRALLEYAEKVTRDPSSCRERDVDHLRAAGWSDAALHDAVQVVAYFNYINRIADALGVVPEDSLPVWGKVSSESSGSGT